MHKYYVLYIKISHFCCTLVWIQLYCHFSDCFCEFHYIITFVLFHPPLSLYTDRLVGCWLYLFI